jgi:Fe-S-cluster containining protein
MTQDDIRAMVAQRGGAVRAVYAVHDELRAAEPEALACAPACPVCCWQLFGVTDPEWQEVRRYLIQRGLVRKVQQRNAELLREWQAYLKVNHEAIAQDAGRPMRDWYLRASCVFLNERQLCDVYPVRPLNCRTMSASQRCTPEDQSGAARWRWPWERWLQELLWERDARARVLPDLLAELQP